MGLVSPTQSSAGETIEAADINTPVNQLAAVINGSIETANLADGAVTTAKLADDSVAAEKIDWAATGADGGIWWEEVGRTTLSVAGDTISVTPIAARKYLKIIISVLDTGGTINATVRFNNDSGTTYANRSSANGAADGTGASGTSMGMSATASANPKYIECEVINIAAQEKLVTGHAIERGAAGAGTVPSRAELANKWANTADQITRVDVINTGTGDFAIGSEVVVLGHN
jgi:hypothetical protein